MTGRRQRHRLGALALALLATLAIAPVASADPPSLGRRQPPDPGIHPGRRVRALHGHARPGPGQFTIPFDLTLDAAGNVYVADDGAERITKLAPDGSPVWIADQRTDPRLAGHPHSPTFDAAGNLVVSIDDTLTLARLDPETGTVVDARGGGGCDVAVDAWDRQYVLDCSGILLTVRDAEGRVLATDSSLRLGALRLRQDGRGIAISADGTLLLVAVTPP